MKIESGKNSRRDFLRKGITGVAGLSLLPAFVTEENKIKKNVQENKKKKIIYRTLGQTGIKVPIVGIPSGNPNLLRKALDEGITYIDTAHRYGAGSHEAMIGGVLKERPRDSFVIGTKIYGLRDKRTGLLPKNLSASQFKADFHRRMDESLKRLYVDYVDILYLHGVNTPEFVGQSVIKEVMLELKEAGKTLFLGTSFHHKEVELIKASLEAKIYDVIITTYNFRQPHREEVKEAIADATKAGLGIVAMKVMAGVYWDRERKYPINARAALKWVLQDENVHTTIPGITSFDQLELDLSVMEDLRFTPQEKEELRFGEKMAMTGLYCAQCGNCRRQCKYHLDIPTVMRSYMYAYGYKNPAKARETLEQKYQEEITCRECSTCAVTCTMGFDIPNKIQDIIRVLDVPNEFLV